MSCPPICPLEQQKFHPASPGPVKDEEVIYRGVFDMHLNKAKRPKLSLIRASEMQDGTISFWRAGIAEAEGKEAAAKIIPPVGKVLEKIATPTAKAVRALKAEEIGRIFSVVDDCDTGNIPDPMHCGLRLCEELKAKGMEEHQYDALRQALVNFLETYFRNV